jgi:hypothetical protein
MSFVSFGSRTIEADHRRFLLISIQLEAFGSEPKSSLGIFWRLWLYGMLSLFAQGSASFVLVGSRCQNWLNNPNF